jgi:hypothetical protein
LTGPDHADPGLCKQAERQARILKLRLQEQGGQELLPADGSWAHQVYLVGPGEFGRQERQQPPGQVLVEQQAHAAGLGSWSAA